MCVVFALWETPVTGDTYTHTLPRHFSLSLAVSLSLSRRAADEEGAGGKEETKGPKRRSALFEIVLSYTSYFCLLLWETQTHTFTQP